MLWWVCALIDWEKVRDDLTPFEMQALSEVMHAWAVQREGTKNRRRLQLLRSAFRDEDLVRKRRGVPAGILFDEYRLVHYACLWAREAWKSRDVDDCSVSDWLTIAEVEYSLKNSFKEASISKPFPVTPGSVAIMEGFISGDKPLIPSAVAYGLIAGRFGMGPYNVKRLCSQRKEPRGEMPIEWCLLASCFLELNAAKSGKAVLTTGTRILDCLLAAGYPPFKLYSLVRISHCISNPICLGRWRLDMIDRLCSFVWSGPKPEPFRNILIAE
jgi:hypothetical protein